MTEELLHHPFTVTKMLQSKDSRNFFEGVEELDVSSVSSGGLTADGIGPSMKQRVGISENKILLAAVNVDKCIKTLLDGKHLTKRKDALFEIAVRLNGLQVISRDEVSCSLSSASSAGDKLVLKNIWTIKSTWPQRKGFLQTHKEQNEQISNEFLLVLMEIKIFDHSYKKKC